MKTGTITSNKAILKRLFVSAFFVVCVMELANSVASMIDSFFVGNYIGSMGMAAAGFSKPFFSFVGIISGLLGLGIQLLCSHYIGKGSLDNAQKALETARISLANAQENLDTVKTQYHEGDASRVDFTIALTKYADALGKRVSAFYTGQIAESKLFSILGRVPEYDEMELKEK